MALEAKGIKRSYGDFSISLDLAVDNGETLALVGPSGSGKTTALSLIAGLSKMEEGQLFIDGEDISALPAWKRNISIVFQDLALFPHLDVGGNIDFALRIGKRPKPEREKTVEALLDLVRLGSYASRKIHTLSGGEKQRVAIARSLASKPRALLLDEPFSSLDTPLRSEMRREFLDIRSRSDAPCVFVTHDREEAAMLGHRLALMADGRIVETGSARELFLFPKTEFAARFFASGQVLPSRAMGKRPGGIEVASPLGTLTIPSHLENVPLTGKVFIPNDAVSLSKREEAGWKSFCARCTDTIFEGSKLVLKLQLVAEEKITLPFEVISNPRTEPPRPGSTVDFWVNESLLRFVK